MNSRRMPPGAFDEGDAAFPEGSLDDGGTPDDVVTFELGVQIVGEEGGMRKPSAGRSTESS